MSASVPETTLEEPVFLFASERSGTNMTRAIFGAHPKMAAPTSPHLLLNFLPRQTCYGDLERDANFRRLAEDVCTVLDHQLGGWEAEITPADVADGSASRSLIGAVDYVYRRERDARGAERVFFKENEAFDHAHWLLRRYPDARFIYLVRDGRDMVLSYRRSLSHFGTIADGAEIWRDQQRTCLQLLNDPDFGERVLPIHYEDILAYPEDSVRKMCDFVGLEFHPDMLAFHEKRDNQEAAESVHSWDNIDNPIMRSNYGKYRDGFTDREVETIESIAYRELHQAGYPLEQPLEHHARSGGGLRQTLAKGWDFLTEVAKLRKMMDLDELLMRRERVRVFDEMETSLEVDHMEPMLTCRALTSN